MNATTADSSAPTVCAMSGLRLLSAAEDDQRRPHACCESSHAPVQPRHPLRSRSWSGSPARAALPAPAKPACHDWTLGCGARLLRYADNADCPVTAVGEDGDAAGGRRRAPGNACRGEVLKAALDARQDPQSWQRRRSRGRRRRNTRLPGPAQPAPADTAAWQRSEESDGRWFWVGALPAVGVESWMRRTRRTAAVRTARWMRMPPERTATRERRRHSSRRWAAVGCCFRRRRAVGASPRRRSDPRADRGRMGPAAHRPGSDRIPVSLLAGGAAGDRRDASIRRTRQCRDRTVDPGLPQSHRHGRGTGAASGPRVGRDHAEGGVAAAHARARNVRAA